MLRTPSNRPHSEASKGHRVAFTLIELVVVIAIIAILASILFPVFARGREKARQASATSNVKQLLLGLIIFATDEGDPDDPDDGNHGMLPGSLLQVAPYVGNDEIIGEPLGVEYYKWSSPPYSYHYLYPPEEPEGTDSFDGTLDSLEKPAETKLIRVGGVRGGYILGYADGHAKWVENPDGVDKVEEGIKEIQASAARAAARALIKYGGVTLTPETVKQKTTERDTVFKAVSILDPDKDGVVKPKDLSQFSPSASPSAVSLSAADADFADEPETPMSILFDFGQEAMTILNIDPNDPLLADEGIPNGELAIMAVEKAGELFSYENLCDLTIRYSTKLGPAIGLCSKLLAAEAAEERGNLKARDNDLQAYSNQLLRAQKDKSFSLEDAEVLEVLRHTVKSAPE